MIEDFVAAFVELVRYSVPFVIVWRIGIFIVNVLLDAMTGGHNGKIQL